VASVARKAASFMWATISTSPREASTVTQVASPSAPNFGSNAPPSSRSLIAPGLALDLTLSFIPSSRSARLQIRALLEASISAFSRLI
jgi:hypothetical protein